MSVILEVLVLKKRQFLKPVDLIYGMDGNIYVLDAEDGMVKVFNKEGEFQRSFGDTLDMKNPTGICITEDLTLVVSDTGNNKLHFFAIDGKYLYSKGDKTPSYAKTSIDDYWSHLGTFNGPTGLASSGGKIYVLDSGNQRVQIFEKGVVKPVLSVDKTSINFPQSKSGILENSFTITNSTSGTLSGSIETDVPWLNFSENTFTVILL
ncbi:MAG: NHL repeat-containing protein [Caldisericia bacterium]